MNMYQETLLDYYRNPRNKGYIAQPDFTSQLYNPSCGDCDNNRVMFLIIMFFVLHLPTYISLEFLQQKAHILQNYVNTSYWHAIMAYISIFIFLVIFFIPSTIVLTIAGGFLFGIWWGTVYTIIGAISGSLVLFFLARYIFKAWIAQRFTNQLIYFNREIKQYGVRYLLIAQLLPFTPPLGIISIIASITHLSWWTYAWTTALGIVPSTLIYSWAGQRLHTIQSVGEAVSFSVLLLLFVLALLIGSTIMWNKMRYAK